MSTTATQVIKDLNENSLLVSREFSADIATVWRAYTESEILDKWWAPAPWRAETKFMNFSPGGYWHYAMVGPDNTRHWGRMNYLAIDTLKSYDMEDVFCDENGETNSNLPMSKGSNVFTKTPNGCRVDFKVYYPNAEALKTVLEMGMEQGIIMCFEQLEKLIAEKAI